MRRSTWVRFPNGKRMKGRTEDMSERAAFLSATCAIGVVREPMLGCCLNFEECCTLLCSDGIQDVTLIRRLKSGRLTR